MAQDRSPRIHWLEETVRGTRILDIGFVGEYEDSTTHLRLANANPDSSLFGLDLKANVPERVVDEGVRGDLFRLPFDAGSFDAVVLAEVLEHLRNPVDAIEEIARVLVPNGKLFLTTPNPFSLYRYLRHYMFSRSLDQRSYLGADDHVLFIDPLSLSSLLVRCGFTVDELTFRNVSIPKFPTLPDWGVFKHFPFSRGGSYTCVVAQKEEP